MPFVGYDERAFFDLTKHYMGDELGRSGLTNPSKGANRTSLSNSGAYAQRHHDSAVLQLSEIERADARISLAFDAA